MQIRAGLSAIVLLAGLGTTAVPAAAAPASVTAVITLQNDATKLCLTANVHDSQLIRTTGCSGFNEHKWDYVPSARPEFGMLKNIATGLCLDANANGVVYSNPCNVNNTYQWWYRSPELDIKHGATGRYLDSNGGGDVYTLGRNGGPNQRWR
ncbi:ricin-type beta-trefoil lectin domain protein [Kribbella sp. NPDC056951]|uniref:RICIN domain-containing protein n=1 Tax=Kribbella sp. NPDC056951 TaxID=3345978 RepID=UPI00363119B0